MVEPFGLGIDVAEQQCWPKLVILVVQNGQDARMIQRLDDLKLTCRRTLKFSTALLGCGLCHGVLAHTAEDRLVLERNVLGESILIARPVFDEITQHVVADAAGSLRGSDSGALHRPRKRLSDRDVDGGTLVRVDAGADAADQRF